MKFPAGGIPMLDIKRLRTDLDKVKQALVHRGEPLSDIEGFAELDSRRRELLTESESLKNRRNVVSQEVARKKRAGEAADDLIAEMREVGDRIKRLDDEVRELEQRLEELLLSIPNVPHESVPVGASDADNVEVRRWGDIPEFSFAPAAHWEIAAELDILDFERAAKVAGSRFVFLKRAGARLERALIQWMLDVHVDRHGYVEMMPPYIVNEDSLRGTGQLPKFAEDVFRLADSDYYLIPTAEVPVTNYHRNEILSIEQLPIRYAAYSGCFRSEAGSAGRDTRGLIRLHQFDKVELVKLVVPERSYEELESLTRDAERILQELKLPYRVVSLCTGDLGFSSAKTYDLEVWFPHSGTYREISSCSNFEDFQARRANIRFRRGPEAKPEFVHTLNGSGLAVGRTVAAILENYQQEDGSVIVPEVLRPYMGGMDRIQRP
jgi:seryl-tRNA synthetase